MAGFDYSPVFGDVNGRIIQHAANIVRVEVTKVVLKIVQTDFIKPASVHDHIIVVGIGTAKNHTLRLPG